MSGQIKLYDSNYQRPLVGEEITLDLAGLPITLSKLVPPGEVILMEPNALVGRRVVVNPHDRFGNLTNWWVHPGYTRYTLGAREAARDRRRHA